MSGVRVISGIFRKEIKDVIKNKEILMLFVIFPIIGMVLSTAMKDQVEQSTFFIAIFGTIHVILTPIVCTATIMAEEKEKNTLRVLVMNNVKPFHYMISIGGFVFIATMITGLSFVAMGGYESNEIGKVIAYMALGCVGSIILGLAVGGISKNVSSANGIALPIGMTLGFIPMISRFDKTVDKIANVLYGHQISKVIEAPSEYQPGIEMFLVIAINYIIFLTAFIIIFRRNRFEDR